MAKIIKVGSQNPTFTSSKTKKASPIHTHRNSNEATNPFKFTNFEGKTLPFECADVFGSVKPQAASKMRMIASSVAGSMNKMRSSIAEPIVNFVRRVRTGVVNAWDYAVNTNISDVPGIRHIKDYMLAQRQIPALVTLSEHMEGIKQSWIEGVERASSKASEMHNSITSRWNSMISNISFAGKNKYMCMSVSELETHFAAALAEGGNA